MRIRQRAIAWPIVEGVDSSAGDISISLTGNLGDNRCGRSLTATLHFSGRDLKVVFDEVILVRWSPDWDPVSDGLNRMEKPRIPHPKNPQLSCVYPLMNIEPSRWVYSHAGGMGMIESRTASHYVLLSESATLQVLAYPGVSAEWLPRSK